MKLCAEFSAWPGGKTQQRPSTVMSNRRPHAVQFSGICSLRTDNLSFFDDLKLCIFMQVVLSVTLSRLYRVLGDFHIHVHCPLAPWCKTFY